MRYVPALQNVPHYSRKGNDEGRQALPPCQRPEGAQVMFYFVRQSVCERWQYPDSSQLDACQLYDSRHAPETLRRSQYDHVWYIDLGHRERCLVLSDRADAVRNYLHE